MEARIREKLGEKRKRKKAGSEGAEERRSEE
jgi:hypothetical protein